MHNAGIETAKVFREGMAATNDVHNSLCEVTELLARTGVASKFFAQKAGDMKQQLAATENRLAVTEQWLAITEQQLIAEEERTKKLEERNQRLEKRNEKLEEWIQKMMNRTE